MSTLLVGFDSAWTATKSGAIVAVVRNSDGTFADLVLPRSVQYPKAASHIHELQGALEPTRTLVLLDQPTIVKNAKGQRPVETIVGSVVGRRYGGVQPANTSKREMFGPDAPMWQFLNHFGGPSDPMEPDFQTQVLETYPVLAMIAMGWMLPDPRPSGRLPKYNPRRRSTFSASDWQHVCQCTSTALLQRGLTETTKWVDEAAQKAMPCKCDQDCLDACICLLVALHLAEGKECLLVGDRGTGYMIVPHSAGLATEFESRCTQTNRTPSEWVRTFRFTQERPLASTTAPQTCPDVLVG